jgi:transposase
VKTGSKKFRLQVLKVREEKGLSLVETGEIFGIHKQTIYNLSKGVEEKKREKKAVKLDSTFFAFFALACLKVLKLFC